MVIAGVNHSLRYMTMSNGFYTSKILQLSDSLHYSTVSILKAIGSYLVLKSKKLTVEARTPFFKIQKAVSKMNGNKRLEPEEKTDITPQTDDLQPQHVVWGG
jgi:hypothetical protein